jgi:hypothetical protein
VGSHGSELSHREWMVGVFFVRRCLGAGAGLATASGGAIFLRILRFTAAATGGGAAGGAAGSGVFW